MLDIASSPPDMARDHRKELSETVNHTVRAHLGDEKIISVLSRADEDFDGDEIISITIVINTTPASFDSKRLSSLVRMLRAPLAEIGVYAFPMISYMTENEQRTRRR